jgi:hypothetical protein
MERGKRFEDCESIDDDLRAAIRAENGGRDPDNFIEDAQGGSVDSETLKRLDPAADQKIADALDPKLVEYGATLDETGNLTHD